MQLKKRLVICESKNGVCHMHIWSLSKLMPTLVSNPLYPSFSKSIVLKVAWFNYYILYQTNVKQERIQSNANHPLAESMGYIKFEGM